MPLVNLSDATHLGIICDAEPDGHPGTRAAVWLVYARHHVIPILIERWGWLVPLLGLTSTTTIAIIGAGYGYSLDVLADMGITRVVGTEPTAGLRAKATQPEDGDVQTAIEAVGLSITSGRGLELYTRLRDRPGQARCVRSADLLADDLASNQSRTRVRNALLAKGGSSFTVITENVLTVLSNSECTTLAGRIRQINGVARVVHLVSEASIKAGTRRDINTPYNSKTVTEWKALLPNDTVVGIYTKELS